jgi:hypothetical protein
MPYFPVKDILIKDSHVHEILSSLGSSRGCYMVPYAGEQVYTPQYPCLHYLTLPDANARPSVRTNLLPSRSSIP